MARLGRVVNITYTINCVAIKLLFSFFCRFFYKVCTCASKRADSLAVGRLLDENITGLTSITP